MKAPKDGYRVAVVGASSLLGKELLNVLEEHPFPFSRLVTFSDEENDEPELPILDLREGLNPLAPEENVASGELDFAFVAAWLREMPSFLDPAQASGPGEPAFIVDLGAARAGEKTTQRPIYPLPEAVSVPFLDQHFPVRDRESYGESRTYISAHSATIVISSLLLRLAEHFPLKSTVADVFVSVSEMGPRGIEELQKQTLNLLSFQKVPCKVFGAQLAFNLLPRSGGTAGREFLALESHLREQIKGYLQGRVPLPALRLIQVPAFYSLAVSLFVETVQPVAPEKAGEALQGERVEVRRSSQDSPDLIEVAGSDKILVDSVTADPNHPTGLWIWAVADNLRLAATNAVDVAGRLCHRIAL